MAALSVKNVVLSTTLLCSGFGGGSCATISHSSLLVPRHSQLERDETPEKAEDGFSFIEARKPIRIVRHGDAKPTAPGHGGPKHVTKDKCGSTHKVISSSDKWLACPDSCPFYAQNRNDDDFCTFACVQEAQCSSMNPTTPIGDMDLGVCRACVVDGCKECDHSVSEDRCGKCASAYDLMPDGTCKFRYWPSWMTYVGYTLGGIICLVVLWLLDMICRPNYNQIGLEHALAHREATKLRQPKDENGKRELFPLTTNLLKTNVAGPGMMLHFNFQVAIIIWALFVAGVWMAFAAGIDEALWILGTRKFGTPRMNCILVAWGYETQQRLMWTKVLFLWIVYIFSFLGAIAYGIYQLREFQEFDYAHKTMKDYVVMVTGLPEFKGTDNAEDEVKEAVHNKTQQTVVGVSVCWDFAEYEDAIVHQFHDERQEAEKDHGGIPPKQDLPEGVIGLHKTLLGVEGGIFGVPGDEEEEKSDVEEQQHHKIDDLLKKIHSSTKAFVVFETEDARDKAVEAETFEVRGKTCTMNAILNEPDTVNWQNFGHDSTQEQVTKIIGGFGIIGLACAAWGVVFYSPYAYYVMTFDYSNGRQPGFMLGFSFSMIVVVGNQIMIEVCNRISDWVGFRFRDEREACYMILYNIACCFNVGLDFITTYFTAEMVLDGLGFRTYFGVPLSDVPTFTAKFETFGMQRMLAENTYGYAFPASFLIPYLIEPFAAMIGPYLIGRWVVKNHVGLQGRDAEEWLEMPPMDMGRYADLLLNTILGIMIFFFPGGYTWILFLGMAGSHSYIFLMDQYKVLREIPSCVYASYDIEWWTQAMFAPIIGIMTACLVFKGNCEPGYHCTTGIPLIALCTLGWFVHVVVHIAVLVKVIPMFGKPAPDEDKNADKTFMDVCHATPCSWFSGNPIHCLRSKYHFEHKPPCSRHFLGKERYMKANPKLGCYYEEAETEKVKA